VVPVLVVVCAEPLAKVRFLDTTNRDEHVRERQASSLATQASAAPPEHPLHRQRRQDG